MRIDFAVLVERAHAGQHLTEEEAEQAVGRIMEGGVSSGELRAWLLELRAKGEALSEIVGAARAMRARASRVRVAAPNAVDTCGTGGDGLRTVNISTIAALVAAGAGATVAKHGNRSVTSACGSADVLEALGVAVDVEPPVVERCISETGFGFMFAPRFHPAMKAVAPVRRELGVPTIFNLLGPLTNPAGVKHQVVGVADSLKLDLYAQALKSLGAVKVLVVHGTDGQDELSTTGPTEVAEFNAKTDPDRIARYTLVPETFGIRRARVQELTGGDPKENARIALEILNGKAGLVRDAVLLNAAAALYVAGAAGDLNSGLALARQSLDQGKAKGVLESLRRISYGE
jgi:anthranilate phosphoribosyltransferase